MTFSSRRASSREGSLDQYLKEISQYPLIDRAEEARLAKLIRKGEEDLVKAFNEAIAKILADGTYEKINSTYFEFDVYGRPSS